MLDRVVEYGDGWIPLRIPLDGLAEFGARIAELRSRAADAGRGHLPVTLYGAVPRPAALESYKAAGVDRVLFEVPDAPTDDVLRHLDELAGVGTG